MIIFGLFSGLKSVNLWSPNFDKFFYLLIDRLFINIDIADILCPTVYARI